MPNRRMESLDFFRGVAAIAVVLYHFRLYLGIRWLEIAFVAVDLFFVLSGIVLAMRYADAIADGLSFADFASARLQRLYPMVLVAGLLVAALNLAQVPADAYVTARSESAWRLFLLVPVTASAQGTAFPPDGPAWSLWAELAVNALWFPVIKYRRHWMGGIAVVAVGAAMVLAWRLQTLNYGHEAGIAGRALALVRAVAGFSVGYLIGRARVRRLLPLPLALVVFLGLTTAVAVTRHDGWRAALAVVVTGSLLLHALFDSGAFWAPLKGLARTLGPLSYPLYLIHAPAGRLLPPVAPGILRWVVFLLIVGGVSASAAVANEWLVERVRHIVRRRRAAAALRALASRSASVDD